jgi:hypothetical protein
LKRQPSTSVNRDDTLQIDKFKSQLWGDRTTVSKSMFERDF